MPGMSTPAAKTSGGIHKLPAGEGLESGWRSWRAGREAGEKLESREKGRRESHYHMRAPILARCFCVTLVLVSRMALSEAGRCFADPL